MEPAAKYELEVRLLNNSLGASLIEAQCEVAKSQHGVNCKSVLDKSWIETIPIIGTHLGNQILQFEALQQAEHLACRFNLSRCQHTLTDRLRELDRDIRHSLYAACYNNFGLACLNQIYTRTDSLCRYEVVARWEKDELSQI